MYIHHSAEEVLVYDSKGEAHSLNSLWLRRQTTKFNGVSTLSKLVLPNVVGTPEAGFGASGEGYFRLTAFRKGC